jgi:hypothetical protein
MPPTDKTRNQDSAAPWPLPPPSEPVPTRPSRGPPFDIDLSVIIGDPGKARTCDLPLRRRLLYPAELRGLPRLTPER